MTGVPINEEDNKWGTAHYVAFGVGLGALGLGAKGLSNFLKHKNRLKDYLAQVKHHHRGLKYSKTVAQDQINRLRKLNISPSARRMANSSATYSLKDIRHYRMGVKEYARRYRKEQSRNLFDTILKSPEISGGYRSPQVYPSGGASRIIKKYKKIIDKVINKTNGK